MDKPIVFTLHGSRVIHIDTPCGLITIGRNQEDKRRIEIGLPAGLNCSLDRTGCLDRSKYLKEENGKVVPRYKLLVPVLKQGELLAAVEPTAFIFDDRPKKIEISVDEEQQETVPEKITETVQ